MVAVEVVTRGACACAATESGGHWAGGSMRASRHPYNRPKEGREAARLRQRSASICTGYTRGVQCHAARCPPVHGARGGRCRSGWKAPRTRGPRDRRPRRRGVRCEVAIPSTEGIRGGQRGPIFDSRAQKAATSRAGAQKRWPAGTRLLGLRGQSYASEVDARGPRSRPGPPVRGREARGALPCHGTLRLALVLIASPL